MSAKNRLDPIPQPPTKPVVGNMLSLDTAAPVQHLTRLAKELGPIFWLDMMGSPIVVVSGHDLVDELSDEKRFDKAVRGALRRVRAVGGDGLFTADTNEPNWTKAHNILLQPFGNRAMQSYHPSMVDIAEQLVKKWERLNADDEIDVVHDMTALTLDTIGLCGFDYRFNSFYRRDYHPFVESLVRSLETIMMTRGLPFEQIWMQKRRKTMAEDVAFMNAMVDDIIAERRKGAEAIDDKKDMLAAMMTGVDRATGEQLDDVNIRYQINTFLIAGHETTSGLLSCTLYALLKHPEILKKAYDEVDRVFGPDVDARPTYQQVTQLTYITQILKEALRLWPPAPAYGVSPLKDETIGGGKYKLRKGTFTTILVTALHRDPSVWGPNPDAFDPENFSREAEAKRPVNAWKPFGNGQRACIGRGFAMHEAALALGMILQRFRVVDHQRYQMHLKETLTMKPEGFKIKVRPRTDRERGAYGGPAVPATSAGTSAPRATARPGHNTPLLVLYGSNLGTAEELATRVADLAEVNGFASKLGPLDDYAGKLPEEGGVLIFCASYNGAPPDNASQFVKWLHGDASKDALSKVRYAVFGCGNSDWAATYQSVPRFIDEQLAARGARSLYARGEGDARSDLDGQFEKWFAARRACGHERMGSHRGLQPERRRRTALQDRAGRARRGQRDCGPWRRRRDEGARQRRTPEQERPQSVRALDAAHRGAVPAGRELPRRRPSQRGAAQRSGTGRRRCASLRLPPGRPDQAAGRPGAPRAAAGRGQRLGRPAADRFRRASAGRDAKADPDHGGAYALPGDQAESCSASSATRPRLASAIAPRSWPSANRCSIFSLNIRPASCRSTPISKCSRCLRRAIIRSRPRHRSILPVAASLLAWSAARRRPGAASTRASARTI
ncbi:cytochrome P450/flavodoxin [Bradyrhizobium sp. LM2.7]